MKKNFFIKLFVIISIISIITYGLNDLFKVKNERAVHLIKEIKNENFNVGIFGGSHALNAYAPSLIYEEDQLKGYNFSMSGMPIYLTYFYMKEVLETNKFDLIILDVYYAGLSQDYFVQDNYVNTIIDNMPMSLNKIEAINNCISKDKMLDSYFPINRYHTRWNQLNESDFSTNRYQDILLGWENGEKKGSTILNMPISYPEYPDNKMKISEKSKEYLKKIVKLVKDHDTDILFVTAPHEYDGQNPDTNWIDEYQLYNFINEFSKKMISIFLISTTI